MNVRPLEKRDVEAWSQMRSRLWPDADGDGLYRETIAFVAGDYPVLSAVIVAEDEGGALRGFVEIFIRPFSDGCDSMPVPHVEGWYVEPSHRGAGLGRRLVRAAENWAGSRGFSELASDTEIQNEGSRRAHEACGFQEVARIIKFRKPLGSTPEARSNRVAGSCVEPASEA